MPARPAAPATAGERRDQSMSFGDQRQIVYQALISHLGSGATDNDGDIDIWIQDLAADWVVWYSYTTHSPGAGTWQLSYSMDADNVVTFTGDPVAVVEQTSYVPAEAKKPSGLLRVTREAMADLETRKAIRSEMRNIRETRLCRSEFELREVPNGSGGSTLVFTGFASVTGDDATYEMEDWLGAWDESVSVGAFGKTLRENADVAFLVNHEGLTLARTKPGTLKLSEVTTGDPTGLHSEAGLDPKSPHVKALRSAVERGDIDEMSFAFRVTRQEWNDDYTRRWINEVNLHQGDVSAVNYGANPHTGGTVAIRKASELVPVERLAALFTEMRAGSSLSSANQATLKHVLSLVSAADNAVDEAQPLLAGLLGVPNPDDDDDPGAAAAAAGEAKARLDSLVRRNRTREAQFRLTRRAG